MTKSVVIIGIGPHGRRMIQAVSKVTGVQLKAVVDLKQQVLEDLQVEDEIIKSTDLQELLTKEQFDIACITTTAPSHLGLALLCMKAKIKYLVVEKPMACSVEESAKMLEAAQQYNATLVVDHPRRYTPSYVYLKNKIQAGDWGELRSIYIQRPGIGLGCLATHSFDLANYLSGKTPQKVTAWIDEPLKANPRGSQFEDPGGTVVLDYGTKFKALILQIEDGAGPMSVEINLTKARVSLDEKMDYLEVIERDLMVKKGPRQGASYQLKLNPEGFSGKRSLVEDLTVLLKDLITNQNPKSDIHCGYDSIETLVAAYVSHENGNTPVSLPLSTNHFTKWLPVT